MIRNDYNVELSRLGQIDSVDIPHLKNVQMIVKDRVDTHSYEPIIYDHLKNLSDEPSLPNDLTQLRDGNNHDDIPETKYPNIQIDNEYTDELDRHVRYLKIYRKDQITSNKALVYLHGGAYYGGTPEDTLPFLNLLATKFNGVIYSVDYGIAPEKPYPSGIEDSLAVTMEASNHYQTVSLSGDSAGASIALGVSELCHLTGICDIYKNILFYPTVVHGSNHNGSLWNDRLIPINDKQRRALHNNYTQFKQLDTIMTDFYTNHKNVDLSAPILSPLYADPLIFKNVVVMTGEFDPFRLQDEAFIQKVGMAGCTAKYIRYGGLGHAFLNYVGRIPAVEDALTECADALN
ncbi:alpha/beta hydrolase fold domain-containing protein [Companilactobacillus kimchiensis]|uniref:Esterase lipase n=1 Tax=Companilactobacillus kimchiensis TaxID=993692 RepID=A0A0R2LCG8_9LACO|nr:alpha/beta hydrolase fold domain-containing protein [Companilactobacillus kimchiensis]KRN99339.1 esterase lipase [Companilactobacillus kimchiensis]